MDASRFIVITGGPGSGKTTLLDALRETGHVTMPEAGRNIIRAQQAVDGPALPWRDPALFAELMLSWDMRSYEEARQKTGTLFFDRGIPDTIGYLRLSGLPVPAHTMKAGETLRYHRKIFLAPFWPEIFGQDDERRQSAHEAERTCEAMQNIYTELRYDLVPLPLCPVQDRVRFILSETSA